ncbi:polysaccharide pyruvyl transferase family protein [Pseudothermotoga sp.]|nr:polysaccharide pyruvyl transferase family protein [Pseudothermotoga sp.]MCX7812533.1 polysaccharide pyruvyl transferase family protein [Pseudothermotoga sp.]MDW8138814.1 polysaccharide pyruvyl transferase family protein [Pseudothermotoga sp.]
MKAATLFGYYGYDNLGDELLCRQSIKTLKEAHFDKIYLLVNRKKVKDFLQTGILPIDRFDLIKVFQAIFKSDVVVCGGGGILQDQTSLKSLLYYSSLILISLALGKPVLLLANSLGPLKRTISRCIVRFILKRRNLYFIARDPVSFKYAKLVGAKHVSLGTDLAVGMIEDLPKLEKEKRISLCLKSEIELEPIITVAEICGFSEILLVPLSPQDEPACERVSKKYGLRISTQPLRDLVSSSFVVSQRMHGCLISCLAGIPFISLNNLKSKRFFERYFPKYEGFCSKEDPTKIALTIMKLKDTKLDTKKLVEDYTKMWNDVLNLLKALKGE